MRRVIRAFIVVFVGYLCQVCIMPHFAVGSITPNLLFPLIAIITVAYGRFYSFGAASVSGIFMEAMTSGVPLINLIGYTAIGLMGSLIFADKSERKLEQERSAGKPGTNANPYLRSILCTLFYIAWYEAIHMLFIYLNGASLGWVQYGRALGSVVYTVALCALFMVPVRWILGMYAKKTKMQAAG